MMLTARRPRTLPNSTLPAMSAKRVSSPPRPTPGPGWKWVPRCRMMISPALTCCPPNRLTPRRWALESRPLRLDDAPFLCATSAPLLPGRCLLGCGVRGCGLCGGGLCGTDTGDLELGVPLAVTQTTPVAGLVAVVDHADLRAGDRAQDLRSDLVPAELGRVADDLVVIDDEQGGQVHARADLTGERIDGEDVVHRRLLLPATAAHDRVHRELSL